MNGLPSPQPLYVASGRHQVYAVLHLPRSREQLDTAVILCPPFGWDEVASYRPRREWAQRLAAAGYPTLRVNLPGTGDSSGSPHDPDLLDAWTAAIESAASWLLSATGASRVAAVGLELGGLVAYRALSRGASVDELILWGTPRSGRRLVKRLRALSKIESAAFYEGLEPPPPRSDGGLEAAGFALSGQTLSELGALDLPSLALTPGRPKRALILHCDSTPVDHGVVSALERAGAAVTVSDGPGYGEMVAHPQQSVAPVEVIDRLIGWLGETSARRTAAAEPLTTRASVELPGRNVRETLLSIEQPFGKLAGVLAEPIAGPAFPVCLVLLNAGAIRRIGPNRIWVEAARRWAAAGVPSFRLDIESIGDSDGAEDAYREDSGFYTTDRLPQVLATLDMLEQRGVASQFALGGLCAGSYWSFHAALRDPRVSTALLVNITRVSSWDPGLSTARDLRRLVTQRPSWSKVRRAYTDGRIRNLGRWAVQAPARRAARLRSGVPKTTGERDSLLEQFEASGKRAMILFSEGEAFASELNRARWLERLGRSPAIRLEQIHVRNHIFKPSTAQAQLQAALDRAVERELALLGEARRGRVAA